MARPEKVAVVDRVSEQLDAANATLLTDYRGLSVTELAELRAELRKVDATYAVVKNTLTRLAAEQSGMEDLTEFLTGPTALVFCGEDPVGPAKALKAFAEEHEQLVVKGGYFEGSVLDAQAAMQLAELASREELLATLAGMMNNALAGFARLLQAPIADVARLMAALETDGGAEAKGFSPSAPAASTETPEQATDEESAGDEVADDEDVAVEASDAESASSDSSDSDDSDASDDPPDEDDSPDADEDAETIAETEAVEETAADEDLRETAEDADESDTDGDD